MCDVARQGYREPAEVRCDHDAADGYRAAISRPEYDEIHSLRRGAKLSLGHRFCTSWCLRNGGGEGRFGLLNFKSDGGSSEVRLHPRGKW